MVMPPPDSTTASWWSSPVTHLAAVVFGQVDDPGQVFHRHHRALINHEQRPRLDGHAASDFQQELACVVAVLNPAASSTSLAACAQVRPITLPRLASHALAPAA